MDDPILSFERQLIAEISKHHAVENCNAVVDRFGCYYTITERK